jgi:hypothetical protein
MGPIRKHLASKIHSASDWSRACNGLFLGAKGGGYEPLDIVVPYTTPSLTRLALKRAEQLASEIPSRIRVLRMQQVPRPLELSHPAVSLDVIREQTRQTARGIAAEEIRIYLTRDPDETLLKALRPNSILVIGSKKRWWRTAGVRLRNLCEKKGFPVALVYST